MPAKKPSAAADLAARLVQTLEVQRVLGTHTYPLPLNRLAELTDPHAARTLVTRAAAQPAFAERILVAQPRQPDAPVVFRENLALLADSPLLLQFVLQRYCTPAKRLHPLARLAGKLTPELQQPFLAAAERRVETGSLPAFAGCQVQRGVPHLYLQSLPPPEKPEIVLACSLLKALESRRHQGGQEYPTTLRGLLEAVDRQATPTLVRKALSCPILKGRLVLAVPKKPDTPLALVEDQDRLLASPPLLDFLLHITRTEACQAFTLGDLKKKLARPLQGAFVESLAGATFADQTLPPGIGWVLQKKGRLFFLLQDVHGQALDRRDKPGGSLIPGEPPGLSRRSDAAPAGFASLFDEAFNRLDRARGSHNFVSLVDLRRAVPVDRAAFDTGLHQLRVAGRYSLSAAEGRHGLSPEEREAGITEDGTLLLYVSRRTAP
jgi:hypothetical protein